MPNPLVIKDQSFSSQIDAERFFYGLRDKNLATGGDITGTIDFELLQDLYVRYCTATEWQTPGTPVAYMLATLSVKEGPMVAPLKASSPNSAMAASRNFQLRKP